MQWGLRHHNMWVYIECWGSTAMVVPTHVLIFLMGGESGIVPLTLFRGGGKNRSQCLGD